MAADELQVHLKAKDDLTRELTSAIKNIAKLETKLRDLGDATSPEAARDVEKLTKQLDRAYDRARTLTGAVDHLDTSLEQMGASASEADRKMAGLGRGMDGAHRQGKTMVAGWGKMMGVAGAVTAAIGATAGAFSLLSGSINEARTARTAMAQTAAVMRSMGRTEAPKKINQMINQLEAASGIDGDNLREMTNVMFTFGEITGESFLRANELALDLSVAFGKDLQSSAVMVGKSLNDPVKGLTALGRIGVQFTADQEAQIKAMVKVGDVAGAQGIIFDELTRQVGGSAKAQADGIAKTSVAWGNLQEAIGEVLLSSGTGGLDITQMLKDSTKWIKQNKGEIISVLQKIISVTFKVISIWLKWQSIVLKTFGYLFGAMATTVKVLNAFGLVSDNTVASVQALADGFGEASEKANSASKWFDGLSTSLDRSSRRASDLAAALKTIKSRKVRIDVRTALTGAFSAVDAAVKNANTGDTSTPMGVGGPLNLAAAHAAFSGSLNGHRITSGVRSWGLGSARSDHLRGRAMDVKGPHLGSYANAVRAAGGYAALHGQGANRHLHVVPRTHRPQAEMVGGDTLHAEVHFHGGNPRPFDARQAVISGLREAERRKRQRG